MENKNKEYMEEIIRLLHGSLYLLVYLVALLMCSEVFEIPAGYSIFLAVIVVVFVFNRESKRAWRLRFTKQDLEEIRKDEESRKQKHDK